VRSRRLIPNPNPNAIQTRSFHHTYSGVVAIVMRNGFRDGSFEEMADRGQCGLGCAGNCSGFIRWRWSQRRRAVFYGSTPRVQCGPAAVTR